VATARRPKGEPKTRQHTENPRFQRAVTRLGKRIRKLRDEQGWSVDQASERMNVEPVSLRRIEAGTTNPTFGTLLSIAAAYRMKITELLGDDEES
jgi:transcriptional regulator with XRE-family HTH domain